MIRLSSFFALNLSLLLANVHCGFHAIPFENRSRTTNTDSINRSFSTVGIVTRTINEQHSVKVNLAKKNRQEVKANHEDWQASFNKLLEFQKQNGHYEISEDDPYNQKLRSWYEDIKKQYEDLKQGRKTKLTKKRAAALEQVGAVNPF